MKAVFRYILEYVFYGNLFIAFATFCLYQQTMLQVSGSLKIDELSWIVFFGTIFVYDLARVIPVRLTHQQMYHYRYVWLLRNFYPVLLFGFGSLVICSILIFQIPSRDIITLVLLAFVASFYNIPFLFKKTGLFRIRDISYLKSFLIALVWAGVTALLPAIDSGVKESIPGLAALFIERFLLILALMLPFDLRDVAEDKRFGIQTLAQVLGWKKSKHLSILLISLSYLMAFAHDFMNYPGGLAWPAILLSALFALLVLGKAKEDRGDFYFFGLVDGIIVFQALTFWVMYVL